MKPTWTKAVIGDAIVFAVMWMAMLNYPIATFWLGALIVLAVVVMVSRLIILYAPKEVFENSPEAAIKRKKFMRAMYALSGKHYRIYDRATDLLFIAGLIWMQWWVSAVIMIIETATKNAAKDLATKEIEDEEAAKASAS